MKLRLVLALMLGVGLMSGVAMAEDKDPLLGHKMKSLTGKEVDLAKYKGKVLLVVNVASACGATPQYEQLQALSEKYKDKGLVVLGFPCDQFGGQEPGSDEEVAQFCKKNYGVTFDMFSKIDVKGGKAAPFFQHLTSEKSGVKDAGPVKWNFEKFVVSRDGKSISRFRTSVSPDADEVVKTIEAEVAKK